MSRMYGTTGIARTAQRNNSQQSHGSVFMALEFCDMLLSPPICSCGLCEYGSVK